MSSVFLSGSPRNDAGPLADTTAPTLTWATTDPPVTDTARPISAAAIVIFCIIAEPSLFELAKSAPEGMPKQYSVRRGLAICQWRYFRLALSQAQFSELTCIKTRLGQLLYDSGASDELSASGYPLSANIGIKRQ